MCLSFSAFDPTAQDRVSGYVYDQSNPSVGLGGIGVDEIDSNDNILSTTTTSESGHFSLNVKRSSTTLGFSNPDYQEFSRNVVALI